MPRISGVGSPSSCWPRPVGRSWHWLHDWSAAGGRPAALGMYKRKGDWSPFDTNTAAFSCTSIARSSSPWTRGVTRRRRGAFGRGVVSPPRVAPRSGGSWNEGVQLGAQRGVPSPSSTVLFQGVGLERADPRARSCSSPRRCVRWRRADPFLGAARVQRSTGPSGGPRHSTTRACSPPRAMALYLQKPAEGSWHPWHCHTRACASPSSTSLCYLERHAVGSWHYAYPRRLCLSRALQRLHCKYSHVAA